MRRGDRWGSDINSCSLLFQAACRFAADGKAHAFHPVPHGTAKCDFTTSGVDRLEFVDTGGSFGRARQSNSPRLN